ncbi:hypothetical protein Dtox_2451 [Desulfofarcimen acetoxidans DSM 771]|uniref:Uncharacterized protein n=1 Tax=Desulfofarcimen acetoxidans (strain ATCC 49208 / DSM 771 / KCTC 5769 / VKM B-1644 / 5575) TaxID=485916 RepID=C8W0K5_DESAS|nr:hypothetical protein [Desulfofarcimen acetoxidans]ACV63260.1 hypothetical protein Dtox_2451 [Desulfofarcimen acetoxidans DSM 771]
MKKPLIVQCRKCKKIPEEILEYQKHVTGEDIPPRQYVIEREGTYNRKTGYFYCTDCYLRIGMPLGTA